MIIILSPVVLEEEGCQQCHGSLVLHSAVPATNVMLDEILMALRANVGMAWKHSPPP